MQKIIGPYEVLEQLGSGGMGVVVHRARDSRLQRDVAIKVSREAFSVTGTPGHASHERFLREARSASSLNHPNICTIHDVGSSTASRTSSWNCSKAETLKEALRGTRPAPADWSLEFCHPDHPRPRRGPRSRHHSPRHQARQHLHRSQAARESAGQNPRLWARQADKSDPSNAVTDATSDSTGVADTGWPFTHPPRIDRRHGRLHVARAGPRRAARWPQRPLLPRVGALRDGHRPAAVSREPPPPTSSPRCSRATPSSRAS